MAGRVMTDAGKMAGRVMTHAGGATKPTFAVGSLPGLGASSTNNYVSKPSTAKPVAKTTFGNTPGLGSPAPMAPVQSQAPSPGMSFPQNAAPTGGNSSVGVSSTGQVSTLGPSGGAAPTTPAPVSQGDWWNQDPNYQTELAGYAASLAAAQQQLGANRAQYDTDFVQTLKNLGWSSDGINNNNADAAATSGNWDQNNMLGAYGRGYNNLNNDYAGRGLLTSSFYGDALGNFGTDFNNQRANIVGQRQNSVNNQNAQAQQAQTDYVNAQARARQSSLGRAAMQGISIF